MLAYFNPSKDWVGKDWVEKVGRACNTDGWVLSLEKGGWATLVCLLPGE